MVILEDFLQVKGAILYNCITLQGRRIYALSVCNTTFDWLTFSLERLTRLNGKCYGSNSLAAFFHFTHMPRIAATVIALWTSLTLALGFYSNRDAVVELTPDNFDRVVLDTKVPISLSPLNSFAVLDSHSAISCRRILCTMVWSLSTV